MVVSGQSGNEGSGSLGEKDNLEERKNFEKKRHDGRSNLCVARNRSGWNNFSFEKQELSKEKGPRTAQKVTKSCLVKKLFKSNKEGLSIVGQPVKPNKDEQEVTSPLKLVTNKENNESGVVLVGPSKGKCGAGKGDLKSLLGRLGRPNELA